MSDERSEMTPEQMDELASAYLDGEATPEEAVLVEGDVRLQALVEELRAVRDLIATPVDAPSQEVQDEMIARALAHRAPVVSLETARRRLRAIPPQARVILAAAAVVAAIALVGVTVFQGQSDEFADDSSPASAAGDAPAMAVMESAPAPAEESEVAADESPMDDSEDSAEVFATEASAEEMMEEEMAVELAEAPMDDGYASDEPAEDQGEPEPMMADDQSAPQPVSEESLLEFATEDDLVAYVVELADERVAVGDSASTDDAGTDLMGCELLADQDGELLSRFVAVVEGAESQVSVYLGEDELRFTQTTPPPDCELFNSHTFLDWP